MIRPMGLGWKLAISVVVAELLGGLGGVVTAGSIDGWYAALEEPPGTPPNAVFGPVWSVLYACIGVSFALVWDRVPAGPAKRRALLWFAAQALLNLLWSPLFFGAQQLGWALVNIVALLVAIVGTIRAFHPLHRPAAWVLVPYLLWVGYATYLNAGFWWLNR